MAVNGPTVVALWQGLARHCIGLQTSGIGRLTRPRFSSGAMVLQLCARRRVARRLRHVGCLKLIDHRAVDGRDRVLGWVARKKRTQFGITSAVVSRHRDPRTRGRVPRAMTSCGADRTPEHDRRPRGRPRRAAPERRADGRGAWPTLALQPELVGPRAHRPRCNERSAYTARAPATLRRFTGRAAAACACRSHPTSRRQATGRQGRCRR